MSWSQDDIIFPTHMVGAPGPLPPGAERLQVKTPDGETLHGVRVPPAGPASGPTTLILGFGGNAWNGEDVASYLHELFPQSNVVAFHYRGYRPSTGKPSAKALLEDAPLVFDAAVERVKPDRTFVVGFSIGSGVAASLAKRRSPAGLILVTPFDSLKKVASDAYPWLPVGLLFQHEIDSAGALDGSAVPVAIIGAEVDEIVPAARTEALRAKVPNLVFERTIDGAGHNDLYGRSEFQSAMDEALEAVAGQ
ncbi:MAG TPA: alpha/beta hydrolase [Sphingomicrobium sp.]|nr:alpha/beta hydrolase [Sphingomicrobium sp.]